MNDLSIYEYIDEIDEMKLKIINNHFKKYDYFFYFEGYDLFLKTPDYNDYAIPLEISVPTNFDLDDFCNLIEIFKKDNYYD